MKIVDTESQTPQPVDSDQPVDIRAAYKLMDQYYDKLDTINKPNYEYGKLMDKDVVTSQRDILRDLVYMIIEDIKTESEVDTTQVNTVCEVIISTIKLLPTLPQTSQRNKKILAKLIGYFTELHKRHN